MGPEDMVLGVLPMFHAFGLNAGPRLGRRDRRRTRHRPALRLQPHARPDRRVRRDAAAARTAGPARDAGPVRPAGRDADGQGRAHRCVDTRSGPGRPVRAGDREVRPPGLRPDRGGAGGHHAPSASAGAKAGSVGRPVPGVEVRLVDEQRRRDVAGRRPGRDLVRGAQPVLRLLAGRRRRPGRGRLVARPATSRYADDDGDLFLVDRRKELVIVSGFNVYPREVEEVLAEHPDVAEAAVIGVPDPETGEAVKAFVVAADGADAATAEDVTAHAGDAAGPLQAPGDRSRWSTSCRTRPPARSPRAGCARAQDTTATAVQRRGSLLIGKPGCHLCDDARAVVEPGHRRAGRRLRGASASWTTPSCRRAYWEQVPVTLVDGEQHDFWRVDPRPGCGPRSDRADPSGAGAAHVICGLAQQAA